MARIKLRNGLELPFNNIFYVDSENGSNTNSGSKTSPFATVNYAVSQCNATGDAIFAKAGTHDVTRIAGTYDSGGLWDDNKAISFIGEQGKTVFLCDGTKHSGRDTHCIMFQNANTKAYQITFDFRIGNRSGNNYQNSICGIGGGAVKGEIINCLFKIDSLSPNFTYSNSGTSVTKFTNCVFYVKANFVGSYSGSGFTIENCVTNFSFTSEGTRKNIYNKVEFDSDYHITNYNETLLNIGVYAGEYSWKYTWGTGLFLLNAKNKTYSLESIDTVYQTKMTSNTSSAPFIATASSEFNSTYSAYKAFNGTNTGGNYDYWSSVAGTTGWIQINYGKRVHANILELSSTMLTQQVANGMPRDFNILASNDNSRFIKLAEFKEQTWNNGETKKYKFRNNIAYQYYRIETFSTNGYGYVCIGEILFKSIQNIAIEIPKTSVNNFINYGMSDFKNLKRVNENKNYVLQDDVSKNEEGLWKTKLDRKPLSISFE